VGACTHVAAAAGDPVGSVGLSTHVIAIVAMWARRERSGGDFAHARQGGLDRVLRVETMIAVMR